MLILALDTSTSVVTVAVAGPEREVLAEVSVTSRGASEVLLGAAHAALDLSGTTLSEVDRVLVGTGPGAFTGIRIALATARAFSLATGAALSRNTTLAALAAPALLSAPEPDVLAVLDAKRRQVFAQRFDGSGACGEILCARPEDIRAMLPPRTPLLLLVGDGAVRYRETLTALGWIPPCGSPLHRVAAAGHVLSADLAPVPPEEVVPLYVREPDAEVRRDLNPWSGA